MITRIAVAILGFSSIIASIRPATGSPALILTPYIEKNNLSEARNASLVDPKLFLNLTSHAGFLTVDKVHDSHLYFWYFPVADKPVNETPWIIWLQGGPGASSLAGLFDEIGPFKYENGKLKPREWPWTANYSVLFIDNPVGAGFSFTTSPDGFVKNMESCSTHLYSALQQFLTIFPELRGAPLFIAGESYAGRYVPAFGHKILEKKPAGNQSLNLKGLMMGNPIIDRIDMANLSSVYYHWGLLDPQGMVAVKPLQDRYSQAIADNKDEIAYDLRDQLLTLIYNITMQYNSYNLLKDPSIPSNLKEFETFITGAGMADALHVGDITFTFSNGSVHEALRKDFLGPVRPQIQELLEHYKIMVYCGQLDLTAPCVLAAEGRRKSWRWSRRADFLKAPRKAWVSNGTLAGYVKDGGGFTEVLVRGAGQVPADAPVAARALLDFFLSGAPLPIHPNYTDKPEYTPPYIDTPEIKPESTPKPTDSPKPSEHVEVPVKTESNSPLITSIVFNVLLCICVIGGVILFRRYKKRSEAFFYSTVEDSISDGILTMT